MAEKRSLLDSIKRDVNRAGSGFGDMFSIKGAGDKTRVRFLDDFEDGIEVVFHDKWNGFNHPCLNYYGEDCPNCDNPEGRTSSNYVWNVWNYENKKVELFMYKANKATPLAGLAAIYEENGTLLDNDMIIQRNGKGTQTSYTVIAGKEIDFGKKVKKFTKKQIMAMLKKTFSETGEEESGYDDDEDYSISKKVSSKKPAKKYEEEYYDEDDEEYEEEVKKPAKKKPIVRKKPQQEYIEEYDEDEDEEDFEDEEDELPPPKKRKRNR